MLRCYFAVNICKIRFCLVRFRHWKRHLFWLWLIFRDYVVLCLSWFSFTLRSHANFCSFPLLQVFRKQESTVVCSKKSGITFCVIIQKELLKYLEFPQFKSSVFGVDFGSLSCPEAALCLGWAVRAEGESPQPSPVQLPKAPRGRLWGVRGMQTALHMLCVITRMCTIYSGFRAS